MMILMFLRFILILVLASPLSCSFELDSSVVRKARPRTGKGVQNVNVQDAEQGAKDLVSGNSEITPRDPYSYPNDGLLEGDSDQAQSDQAQEGDSVQVKNVNAKALKKEIITPKITLPRMTFPVVAGLETKMTLSLNPDKTTLVADTIPKNGVLNLVASFDGFFFKEGFYVKLHPANREFYYVIRVGEGAVFNVKSGDIISKDQILGQFSESVGVSLFKNNTLTPACLKTISKDKVKITYIFSGKLSKKCH